jgi:uncharacterized protein (TIGR00661 family)
MKILMGVQATGNGHISRARAIGAAFKERGILVDYIFSGRDPEKLFDMEMFGDYRCFSGATFSTKAGSVKWMKTFKNNNLRQIYHDIQSLDLTPYDLVMTDFEPITAWAAKIQNKKSIAFGHQNAFDYSIPQRGCNPITQVLMRYFAPANIRLGLHWHHFGQPILPPIADTHPVSNDRVKNKIVVYLGFEQLEQVIEWLLPFRGYEFYIYHAVDQAEDVGNVHLRPLSRKGFQADLADCNGVISNAGFELASEAIHLGKKVLVKPLKGQMEQASNALALGLLNLGMEMDHLDPLVLRHWLDHFDSKQVVYPNVAKAIVDWVLNDNAEDVDRLVDQLWSQVTSPDIKDFAGLRFSQ